MKIQKKCDLTPGGIATKGPSFTLLHASALFCCPLGQHRGQQHGPNVCSAMLRRVHTVQNSVRVFWWSDVKLRWSELKSKSAEFNQRRFLCKKVPVHEASSSQMHSNHMACVDKTTTRWTRLKVTILSTSRPGSLNIALHQSAWTHRQMVGADVFDGFRIGFMRDVTVGGLSWYHANVTYYTRFLFICRFVISVVELNFPTGLYETLWNHVLVCMASFWREEVLLAAVAVGVGATFSAPVANILVIAHESSSSVHGN